MTDYCEKIEKKFEELGLSPRERQVDIINSILNSFIDKKFKNVALSSATGIGKSLIGLIVCELLHELTNEDKKSNRKHSYIVAHTNVLLDQYINSYSSKFDMLRVNGAVNYKCEALSTASDEATAEDCIVGKSGNPSKVTSVCKDCEYFITKQLINTKQHVISNYAYVITSMLCTTSGLKNRLLTIYDESHLISDTYVNFMKIEIKISMLEKYIKECSSEGLLAITDNLEHLMKQIIDENIDINNYVDYLEDLLNAFSDAELEFSTIANRERVNGNFIGYRLYNKKAKKYQNLMQKIKDFLANKYEHVVDIKADEIILSPIFMKDMFKKIRTSEYCLFMSATLDKTFIADTMGLDSNSVDFIYGGYIFNPDNKKVIDCQREPFNYIKMQNPDFMKDECAVISSIIKQYDDTKGIILVTSFSQLKTVQEYLEKFLNENNIDIKIFAQSQGDGLAVTLDDFINYKEPSVLISPSMFEGISLDDDLCRYLVFFKSPYASLGDKRIKYISNRYPAIYEKLAVYKLIQGCGRAVRNEEDWCDTYFIDGSLNKLFKSRHNLWKNEFKFYKFKE